MSPKRGINVVCGILDGSFVDIDGGLQDNLLSLLITLWREGERGGVKGTTSAAGRVPSEASCLRESASGFHWDLVASREMTPSQRRVVVVLEVPTGTDQKSTKIAGRVLEVRSEL